jgi:uncharacterized protein with PQ loop repeat
MNMADYIGLTGAIIAGVAYIPQIKHLITQKCSAGISRDAFGLWFVSSIFVMINAIYTHAIAFIVLGTVQIISTALIVFYSTKYKGQVCEFHQKHPVAA